MTIGFTGVRFAPESRQVGVVFDLVQAFGARQVGVNHRDGAVAMTGQLVGGREPGGERLPGGLRDKADFR